MNEWPNILSEPGTQRAIHSLLHEINPKAFGCGGDHDIFR